MPGPLPLFLACALAASPRAADVPAGGAQAAAEPALALPLGLGLLGGGAALLAATATSVTLLEQLTKSDDGRNPQRFPDLVQAGGFAALTLASMSAGLLLVGAAVVIDDGDAGVANATRPKGP